MKTSNFTALGATVISAAKSALLKQGTQIKMEPALAVATPPVRMAATKPPSRPNTFPTPKGPSMSAQNLPKPELDGITHINVSLDGKTELGRRLHSFYREEFTHPILGPFMSVDSLWHYIAHRPHVDEFRYMSGPPLSREIRRRRDEEGSINKDFIQDFQEIMFQAQYLRIRNNESLYKLFIENNLPFRTYYLHGDLGLPIVNTDRERAVQEILGRVRDTMWKSNSELPDLTESFRNIMSDRIELPLNDGITHVNIDPNGATDLGRRLSHYTEEPFVDPSFGKFMCVEALWVWLTSKEKPDFLRSFNASKLAFVTNRMVSNGELTRIKIPEHMEIMFQVNYNRVVRNPDLLHMMTNCDLPFDCYNKFGPLEIAVCPNNGFNMVEMFNNVRQAVRDPNFKLRDISQVKKDIIAMSYE